MSRATLARAALAALALALGAGCFDFDADVEACRARGLCVGGEGELRAPEVPTGLTATPVAAGRVRLAWTASPDPVLKRYALFAGTSAGSLSALAQVDAPATTFETAEYADGQALHFAIAGLSAADQQSARSAEVTATADARAPGLLTTAPPTQATGVEPSASVILTFSEPMDRESVVAALQPAVALTNAMWELEDTQLRLQPVTALGLSTGYALSVNGRDRAGNALAPAQVSFTVRGPPDTTIPQMVSSIPAHNAANVALASQLSVKFSEAMEPNSVSVTLTPAYELGEGTWSEGATRVTFTAPPAPLPGSTRFTATVNGRDLAQNNLVSTNFSFDTAAPPDATPPTVVSTTPAAGSTGASATGNIGVLFDEAMAPTVSAGQVRVFRRSDAAEVFCAFSWANTTLLVCDPTADLQGNTLYDVTVGTGLRDVANNALAAPYTFSFTTGSVPDTTPPTVASTTPAQGDIGVNVGAGITVTFSEPMEPVSVQNAIVVYAPSNNPCGSWQWSNGGRTVSCSFQNVFPNGQTVSWQVGTEAEDLSGNNLATTAQFSYRTSRLGYVNLPGVAALDGYVVRRDDTGGLTVNTGTTSAYAGVAGSVVSHEYHAYFTFDLTVLPASATRVTAATLYLYLANVTGTPFSGRTLYAQSTDYGTALGAEDWNLAIDQICKGFCINRSSALSSGATGAWLSANVAATTEFHRSVRGARGNRSQYRVIFSPQPPHDLTSNYLSLDSQNTTTSTKPYVYVTYEYP